MKNFFTDAEAQEHPLRSLTDFLKRDRELEAAKKYDELRFVGYVLDIAYDDVTIITCDPFKIAVGGVPRNSMLVMVPSEYEQFPPHFTLLRVVETAPTPLSRDVQQTYFELQKKSMPELDVFTQGELQWGALKTAVLGMFYANPDDDMRVEFSGDVNNVVSAHKYRVYCPTDEILDLIVNSLVPNDRLFSLGSLRMAECRLPLPTKVLPQVGVEISARDFMGTRTAMFGKTRLGKSNVVKLIIESIMSSKDESASVGQLIFDVDGEYANDNPQSVSIKTVFPNECDVYALVQKGSTESKPLKLNFYEQLPASHAVIGDLLQQAGRTSGYIHSYASVVLPDVENVSKLTDAGDKLRATRKVLFAWAALKAADFDADQGRLRDLLGSTLDPGFAEPLRKEMHGADKLEPVRSLDELVYELKKLNQYRRANKDSKLLITSSKKPLLDSDDEALLDFFDPPPGRSGPSLIRPFRTYHDKHASDVASEIISALNEGRTVILDLGNAPPELLRYFSDMLSARVFAEQVTKFSNDKLGKHFVQLYFEEAHNLFPRDGKEILGIYSRIAKEGAKYHVGLVYSTQSPSTIFKDLLAQTENFFIAHLSSRDEVDALARVNISYESLRDDILHAKQPGYMRMLTRSHRFVVPVQARKFEPKGR